MKVRIKGNTKGINIKDKGKLLIPAIEEFLSTRVTGANRKHGWNSPSGVGGCPRHNYFLRTGVTPDFLQNDVRLQRIFDNGTCVHVRLQDYMKNQGVLLEDEAPLFNTKYKIMGTTDGLLLDHGKLAVLEIKSIHSFGFSHLKDAKPEHKMQASIYLFCLNELRKELLRGNRKLLESAYYEKINSFLVSGKHRTKEEKIKSQYEAFKRTLDWLEKYPKPLTDVYFLYENKDTQELKEFRVTDDGSVSSKALKTFTDLNLAIEKQEIPEPHKTYMCNGCRFRLKCKEV